MKFTSGESRELIKAWFFISLAFAILFIEGIYAFQSDISASSLLNKFIVYLIISALTAGIAFLFHELMHKALAQKYGFKAEFEAFDKMLWLALGMSIFGFIVVAPGAVMISSSSSRRISREENGKISLAGPATNIVLALVFLLFLLNIFSNTQVDSLHFLHLFLLIGFTINSLLAFFNLLPIPGFDGRKIMEWNSVIYGISIVIAVALFFWSITNIGFV